MSGARWTAPATRTGRTDGAEAAPATVARAAGSASWPPVSRPTPAGRRTLLVAGLRRDLVRHAHGDPGDDAALVTLERLPGRRTGRDVRAPRPVNGPLSAPFSRPRPGGAPCRR
ncbi:hypothetical protein D9753_33870 [Streptomyces dangxiongensis]|uniref:Uncharacterized protein n=1 Tax=Streptomyces dangxiongensis TaxID=1442032 RepID=A0A3G2JKU5_9ACTN|nr:hypothetical protein [Streptomyces dangxiongensis]AYN43050.1 hypothetical protein D9753_33870 [Streptomyces dangxiongensis]